MSWAYRSLTPIPRRKPLRAQSKKRRREAKERLAVIHEVIARDGLACHAQDVGLEHDCQYPLDPHELRSRAQYPGGHLDPANVILICRWAHDWIHDHPIRAFELGLLKSARLEAQRDATAAALGAERVVEVRRRPPFDPKAVWVSARGEPAIKPVEDKYSDG